jgi:hypothetical protein
MIEREVRKDEGEGEGEGKKTHCSVRTKIKGKDMQFLAMNLSELLIFWVISPPSSPIIPKLARMPWNSDSLSSNLLTALQHI